jgi:glucose/mannose-6-phosphate isomerase
MLDNEGVLKQRDSENVLQTALEQYSQTRFDARVVNAEHDSREVKNIIIAGMGGSALAPMIAKKWLDADLSMTFDIVRGYDLPNYANASSLVVVSSYSGNTEEVLSCLEQASRVGAQIAIVTAGGELLKYAESNSVAHVVLPSGVQPRMTTIQQIRALLALLMNFNVLSSGQRLQEVSDAHDWIKDETAKFAASIATDNNYAKQLAMHAVGKTPIIHGGPLTASVAYKWKISWNENAKNVAFWSEYPEFNHNEFMGWTSHPVEKPFAVFDIVSNLEHPQILKRFEISDRLLSGQRPKAVTVNLIGDSLLKQILWGSILADFVSSYVAVLNGVDPGPVPLITKLKQEL